jgi:integrase
MAVIAEGVEERHARSCRTRERGRCNCKPSYQVTVYDGRAQKRIHKTFRSLTEAKAWRQDASVALRAGTLRASDGRTVMQVANQWLEDARAGLVRNRSGDVYKPSAIRSYDASLRLRVLPKLGERKFSQLRRVDVQGLVDELHKDGLSASTVLCSILPLKAIYRRAVARGEIPMNPTSGLEMPAVRGKRDRIVSPEHAATLLSALEDDRALWATAMYAGLRCGELRALRWEDVSFLDGVIHVRRGWDAIEGEIAPKSRTGVRKVPMPSTLREHLEGLFARGAGDGLVFGKTGRPFDPRRVLERARAAWNDRDLEGLTLHECRHTYASFMIAAGANAKALSTYLGHANIAITMDRYGHLMPGNEAEAAELLETFLAAASG